ncbi:MAG: protein-disulfide reductase DsbD domain-containing protein [Pseudomonadota bacterium]
MMRLLSPLLFVLIVSIGFSLPTFSSAQAEEAQEPDQYVFVRALANQTNISGGETIRLGIEQIIHPKWHTYWKNPGDSGLATSVSWELPEGFEVTDLEWPVPDKIPFGPLTNYGYEGQVTLLQNLKVPTAVGDMPIQLNGRVDLLVCHDICIPESHNISLILNGTAPAEPQKISEAEAQLPPVLNDLNIQYYKSDDTLTFKIPQDPHFENVESVELLPETWGGLLNQAEATIERNEETILIFQSKGERDLSEIETYPVLFKFLKENGEEFIFTSNAQLIDSPVVEAAAATPFEVSLFLQAILFAVFGGMILNLMPCVFPVLSMKALSLVHLKDEDEKEARKHGLAYTAGILVTFSIIAGLLIILKAGGEQIGWGFQLQNPLIILGLAYLVFVIGLNLAGYFEFSNKLSGVGQNLTQKSGTQGAFFTGVLATLVATPCTAPFMGVALGYALTQPALVSMIIFLSLGFGLALPYLALCYIPALRSKLPKPGAWMEKFKEFLSFPLFATAAWLIWVLAQQSSANIVFFALVGFVLIALMIWLFQNFISHTSGREKKSDFAVILLFISGLFLAFTFYAALHTTPPTGSVQSESIGKNWEEFSPETLQSLLEGDDPVFTNMTAAWCITCQVNDKVALQNDAVRELFAQKNIGYLKGDWTLKDEKITQYLEEFNRSGVPLYVFYGARSNETGERPEPVVLPQILTPSIVKDVINP